MTIFLFLHGTMMKLSTFAMHLKGIAGLYLVHSFCKEVFFAGLVIRPRGFIRN